MTEWQTRQWVREKKRDLKKEDAHDNKQEGKYVRIYSEDNKGVYCEESCGVLGHPLSMFEVKHRHWGGLEKAFIDAGYEIRKSSRL